MPSRSNPVVGLPTLRLAIVSAVTTVLLLALAGAVVAGGSVLPSPALAQTQAPSVVRGQYVSVSGSDGVDMPVDGMLQRARNGEDSGRLDASDDRISGDVTMTANIDRWASDQVPEGDVAVSWGDVSIENDGGAWAGTYMSADGQARDRVFVAKVMQLTGTGAYEGLSAVLYWTSDPIDRQVPDSIDGMIFAGDLPAAR